MTDVLQKTVLAEIYKQAMAHNSRGPLGNVVEVVTFTKTSDADRDLGVMGTITEKTSRIEPEPFVNAMNVLQVTRSGGAFQFSDLKMTVAKDSISNEVASDGHTEFNVNSVRYAIQAYTPGPSAWEFVLRRKAAEPTTP